jgi:hypothetical protein
MTEGKRDCRVYYVLCPVSRHHFILEDPADVAWEKVPPQSPCTVSCYLCGLKPINITEPWETGYVSSRERDQLWTLRKPEERLATLL